MQIPIRSAIPKRSAVQARTNYRAYKAELRADFGSRCGYCDDLDSYAGGVRSYHIDHFAPKSLFSHLETEYTNLVYSCPYCNISKSDKWHGTDPFTSHDGQIGFIDPCKEEYDDHLIRTETGEIVGLTPLGRYLIKELSLSLIRHRLIWALQKLDEIQRSLLSMQEQIADDDPRYNELVKVLMQVWREINIRRDRLNEAQ